MKIYPVGELYPHGGELHAFDAGMTRREIQERYGILFELGELVCESSREDGGRINVFIVYWR